MNNKYFTNIFEKYKNDIYRLAYSYTQNKADSDDISQRVFIKYYKNIDKVNKIDEEVKKWLIITTINECKDLFKNVWNKRVDPLNEDITTNTTANTNDNIKELVAKLPENYRLIFHLYYYYGYTTKEISQILSIKETTIRQRLARGRKLLQLQEEENNEKI